MIIQSLTRGIRQTRRRWPLIALVYLMNLLPAFVLAAPVYALLADTVGGTGFGADLAEGFDLVLWSDVMAELRPGLSAATAQLLWIVPLYMLWKTAAYAGLIHALSIDGRSFWTGVGRYTLRALLLALAFLLAVVTLIVLAAGVVFIISRFWRGEDSIIWLNLVVLPTLLLGGLGVLAWMHDFARIGLVLEDQRVRDAWRTGTRWPRRYGRSIWIFGGWLGIAGLLAFLPTLLDLETAAATVPGIWALFVGQQLFLVLRASATVGWVAGETAFFQMVRDRDRPLIAAEAPDIA